MIKIKMKDTHKSQKSKIEIISQFETNLLPTTRSLINKKLIKLIIICQNIKKIDLPD